MSNEEKDWERCSYDDDELGQCLRIKHADQHHVFLDAPAEPTAWEYLAEASRELAKVTAERDRLREKLSVSCHQDELKEAEDIARENTDELATIDSILGAREGESTTEAAKRVVAEFRALGEIVCNVVQAVDGAVVKRSLALARGTK